MAVVRLTTALPTVLTTVLTTLLLAACGATGPGPVAGSMDQPPDPTASPAAPAWFTEREPLPTCAPVDLDQGDEVPAWAEQCLADGHDEDGAELQVRAPTVEGDPIVRWFRAVPGRPGLEVLTDATADRFGSERWERMRCRHATATSDLGNCEELR